MSAFCSRRSAVCLILTTLLVQARAAHAERPPAPWPGPRGEYVFVEAESFTVKGDGWKVVDTPYHLYAVIASGMKSLSGAAAGEGSATHTVKVPAGGEYRLWVRFAQLQDEDAKSRGPFRVNVEQSGASPLERVFDESLDAKTEGGGGAQPPYRWQAVPARLAKGPATITLSKAGGAAINRHARQVDCLLLTTDADYEPHDRDFAPQTYLRIKLASADPARVYFYTFVDHRRAPWYENVHFDKSGLEYGVVGPVEEYLGAGEATGWANISRLLYTDSPTNFSFHATVRYRNPDASASDYTLDFAAAPREEAIVKSIRRAGPGNGVQVEIPPDLTVGRLPRSDAEFAQVTADTVAKLEPIAFGRVPSKFPLITDLSANNADNTPETREREFAALKYLGVNGLARTLTPEDAKDGMRFGVGHAHLWHMGPAGYNEPLLEKIEAAAKAGGEAFAKDTLKETTVQFLMMDEAGAKDLAEMAGSEVDQKAFVAWLKEAGRTPADLGVDTWEQVKLVTDAATAASPDTPGGRQLYYHSQRFRAWSVANFFRLLTQTVRKHYGASIKPTQNFSDGAVYMANMYYQGNDYYTWFRNEALDAATSEDWTNVGATHQLCGWNVALLRSATKYKRQPIQMYCITSYGRRPMDVKLKAYSDIAQGAKFLNFFAHSPNYQGHEPGWYHRWAMYPAIAELTREIGAAEDVLIDAMPRPAETAIIYSIAYDLWSVNRDNAQGMERMLTYLALRHAQVPVDVLSDEDARGEYLRGYKVAYLFGEQLDARTVEPLAAWVKAGGTLVLAPGAGSKDELDQPSDALDKALGISRPPVEVLQPVWAASATLPAATKPQGKVALRGAKGKDSRVDLVAQRQAVGEMESAKVLARFEKGDPAAADMPIERGRVVIVGFLPALSYMRDALEASKVVRDDPVAPLRAVAQALAATDEKHRGVAAGTILVPRHEHSTCPTRYDDGLRSFIAGPSLRGIGSRPVECDRPQIEATFMEGERGWAVPLANYTGEAVAELTLTIRPDKRAGQIRSARLGELRSELAADGSIRVRLPLESTDIAFAEWADQ